MLDSFVSILREYPSLAVFLTVGLGFLIGRIRFGSFSLGSVTSVLLVGILIGQLEIAVSGPLKTFFFMMFLFSIGYSVGPGFFKSLKGSGAKQALFAVLMSTVCCGSVLLVAWIMGYNKGEMIGMFSGSQTCSSLIGLGSESIGRMNMPEAEKTAQLNIIPVCYAVTYIFGTLGTVILLGNFGPKLLGGIDKVKAQTLELEKKLNNNNESSDPAVVNAARAVAYRAYHLESGFFSTPCTVREAEEMFHGEGLDVYVDRVRHNSEVTAPRHDDILYPGDDVVICGRKEYMVHVEALIGEERDDEQLLLYPLDRVAVVVSKKQFIGHNVASIRKNKYMHGVVIRDASRGGQPIEITKETVFQKGDRITVIGRPVQVENATKYIGIVDRPSIVSDLMFVGLAIFIGGLLGALSIWIGGVPISFGTSGGALLAGLFFGWLRSKHPVVGNIPPGALWLMNNLGLNVFIAVVGIEAAPSFVSGLKSVGPMLLVVGAVATLIPLFFGLWLGHKVFKFNPAITLGCCAGTRTCTASLGAVQNALGSTLPAVGYTITYAVSNILLVIWGLVAVMII